MTTRSLFIIKPEAFNYDIVGEIITRLERRGIGVRRSFCFSWSRTAAMELYAEHKGQPYYDGLITAISDGTALNILATGDDDLIDRLRALQGPAFNAPAGTIRGDFYCRPPYSLTHTSDSPEAATREVEIMLRCAGLLGG